MTFDYKKPFTTRDGRKARPLCDNLKTQRPLVVAVEDPHTKTESIILYKEDGSTLSISDNAYLVNERKEVWKNIYEMHVVNHSTRDSANRDASSCRIGLLHIIYEEDKIIKQEYFES